MGSMVAVSTVALMSASGVRVWDTLAAFIETEAEVAFCSRLAIMRCLSYARRERRAVVRAVLTESRALRLQT